MRITCGRSDTLPSCSMASTAARMRLLGRLVRDHDDERRRARLLARADAGQRRARPPLHDALDRDFAVAHALGDRRHGAGLVEHRKPHVVGALVRAELCLCVRLELACLCDKRRHHGAAGDVQDVAGDGRGRGAPAGAGPDEQQAGAEIAVDGHGVGGAGHFGDGRVLRHHGRMHARLDAALGPRRDAQQLDAVAQVLGRFDVGLADRLDALDVDLLEVELAAEGEARQDGELVRRVEAADVEGRVGLGVAQRLRLGQRVAERAALIGHASSGCSCRCR